MVDINLMGEESTSEDRGREQNFAKTVSLDDDQPFPTSSTGETPYASDAFGSSFNAGDPGSESTTYTKRPADIYGSEEGSSRTKGYLVLFVFILAAMAAVYLMFSRNNDNLVADRPIEEPLPAEEQLPETTLQPEPGRMTESGAGETTPPGGVAENMPGQAPGMGQPTGREMLATLSPMERELVTTTHLGAYTISALTKSLAEPNNFTLITYHGNNRFFVEFLSSSDEATSSITAAIQRTVSPMELKAVSQSSIATNGRTAAKVLLAGRMDEQSAFGFQGNLARMDLSQFTNWIRQLGADHNLDIKRFITSEAVNEGGQIKTPVQVHLEGAKANVASFLTALSDRNPTIAVSKIIVSPSNRRTLSDDRLDLVLHFGFIELL